MTNGNFCEAPMLFKIELQRNPGKHFIMKGIGQI